MSLRKTQDERSAGANAAGESEAPPRRTTSRELFGSARILLIEHEGETYALRRTRLDKLILTK